MRQQILDYITEKMVNLTFEGGTKVFNLVAQTFYPLEAIRDFQLPACFILNGTETRDYSGSRVICTFNVILRIVIRDEHHLSEILNKILKPVLDYFVQDRYLNHLSDFPIEITEINSMSGYIAPFEVADIQIRVYYSYQCS